MTAATRAAIVVGASGLVGGHLVARLVRDALYEGVTLLTRRPLGSAGGKVREVVVDFDRPESLREGMTSGDVFCCLGTTIKKAGSQEAFRKVDFAAPVAVGRAARAVGAERYVIVTAVGADPTSQVFYNRVKGETEAALAALEFPRGLKIVRPSLIVGERAERRPAERAAMFMMRATRPLFQGALSRYRAIDAEDVAGAMLEAAREDSSSAVDVYQGSRLFDLAARAKTSTA